jgi:hypothetical protein
MGIIFENAFQVIIWLGKIHPQGRKPKDAKPWWKPPPTVPETLAQEAFQEFAKSSMNGEPKLAFSINSEIPLRNVHDHGPKC